MFKNDRGQSLVQVLVSVAIMGILMVSMVTMQTSQANENRALGEKLAGLDLQSLVTRTLADGSVCTFQTTHLTNQDFDASLVTPTSSPPPIDLGPNLLSGGSAAAPPIVTVGKSASPISNTVIAKSIQLTNIQCPAPCPNPATSNVFTANIQVNFDGTKLVRGILPVASQVTLQTASVGGTMMKITGCGSSGGSGAGQSFGGVFITTNAGCNKINPVTGALSCPATYNDATFYTYMGLNDVSCGSQQDQFFMHFCWK